MNNISKEQIWAVTISIMIVGVVFACFILFYAKDVIVPFVLSWFIYLMLAPIMDGLIIKFKVPRFLAIIITILVIFAVLGGLSLVISKVVNLIIATTATYKESLIAASDKFTRALHLLGINLDYKKMIEGGQTAVPGVVTNIFGTALSLLSDALLVLVFVCFLVIGRNSYAIREGMQADIEKNIRQYLLVKLVIALITAVAVGLTLKIIGLELAFVMTVLVFLLHWIPVVGPAIATILPIPIALVQFNSAIPIFLVIFVPAVIQFIIGNFVEPKFYGKGLDLHPIVVLIALVFWGLLWGPIGMLLSIPLTSAIGIILLRIEILKPLGFAFKGQFKRSIDAAHDIANKTPDIK